MAQILPFQKTCKCAFFWHIARPVFYSLLAVVIIAGAGISAWVPPASASDDGDAQAIGQASEDSQQFAMVYAANFVHCGSGRRINCVVDGDTFWLDGTKIRIADINTPEVANPQCAAEARLADRATNRLIALLNAGPFLLQPVARDEDRYGRELRVVTRDGYSLGDQLVAEGLAHIWRGRRESWCV